MMLTREQLLAVISSSVILDAVLITLPAPNSYDHGDFSIISFFISSFFAKISAIFSSLAPWNSSWYLLASFIVSTTGVLILRPVLDFFLPRSMRSRISSLLPTVDMPSSSAIIFNALRGSRLNSRAVYGDALVWSGKTGAEQRAISCVSSASFFQLKKK